MTNAINQSLYLRFRRTRVASKSVAMVRQAINVFVEKALRVDTRVPSANDPSGKGHFSDSHYYDALDYPLLWSYLRQLNLKPEDVAIEIGCGLGRALCALARWPVKKCIGIELSEELAEGARRNIEMMRGRRAPVEVIAGDAAFVDYSQGTAFYLFNPFGPTTMRIVLDRIRQSMLANPRPIRILYVNPVCEEVFKATPWLRQSKVVKYKLFRTAASLWESVDEAQQTNS